MTRMRSARSRTSSSSNETSSTAQPASRCSTRRRCTYSIAPTSRPRVGCAAISSCGFGLDLARQHELLLVAARERPRGRLRAAAAHVVELDPVGRARRPWHRGRASRSARSAARRSRAARVFSASEKSSTRPWRWRSSRDVPDAGVGGLARRRARHVDAVQLDACPPCGDAHAGDRLDQLALAVAVDARDADDLARAHVHREPAHRLEPAVVAHPQVVAPRAPSSPGCAAPRATSSSTSRPTISSARLRSLAPSRSIVATFLPRRSTEMRSATSSTSCSLCVIRMIDVPPAHERRAARRTARRPPAASAPRSARRGSGRARRGRAP